jgi:hypothetical protein
VHQETKTIGYVLQQLPLTLPSLVWQECVAQLGKLVKSGSIKEKLPTENIERLQTFCRRQDTGIRDGIGSTAKQVSQAHLRADAAWQNDETQIKRA